MKVEILPSCNGCGLCESINSDVFKIVSGRAHAHNENVYGNEQDCKAAASQCPVNAIKIY